MSLPERKYHRLNNYDYSSNGAYFITICAFEKAQIFDEIENGIMTFSKLGEIACEEIEKTNILRENNGIIVKNWTVMPNHVHLLIEISDVRNLVGSRRAVTAVGCRFEAFSKPTVQSISTVIRAYKSAVTRFAHLISTEKEQILGMCDGRHGTPCPYKIWQAGYHDHIIRTKKEYDRIWGYIDSNPLMWNDDCYNEINNEK